MSRLAASSESPSTPSKTAVSVGESGASGGSNPSSSIALQQRVRVRLLLVAKAVVGVLVGGGLGGVGGVRVGEHGHLLESDRLDQEVAQILVVGRLGDGRGGAQQAAGGDGSGGDRSAPQHLAAVRCLGAHPLPVVVVEVLEVVLVVEVVEASAASYGVAVAPVTNGDGACSLPAK